MKIHDILKQFDQLINYSLYTNSSLNDEYNNLLNGLIKSIENSKNILEDVTLLSSNQTHENYFQYTNMISSIIEKAKLSYEQIKLLVDNSEYNLTAILKFDEDEFINFLESKNKITKKDIRDINYYLNKNNTTINRIFTSSDIINKLPNHSLNINDFTNLGKINYDELKKINKKDVSSYLLHFYKDFKEFKQFIIRNDEIWTLIDDNSLVFNNEYDKDVIEYIQNNKNTITKFNSYYLTLLDNEEIIRCFKNGFTNSYILKTMYSSNHENANDIFSTKNILKCQKNSIDFLPYNDLDNKIIKEILENIDLLNRFNDYVIAELINNYLNEEERISLLRKEEFLDSINSYTIELIVNNLSFKSLFNMIQNHSIFNRIQNLNSKITINDKIFIRGFLDSTILVYKSNKEMIIKLLVLLDSDKVLDYLSLPYILDKLTSNEIITIINKQYINFDKVIDEDNIFNKLTSVSIADYINTLWEDKVDLTLISKPKVLRKIFNLDENILNRINIDEINYLFEAIRTKDILSIQDKKYTVMTYRSVIAAYICLGISRTLELINNGNNDIDLDDTKEVLNSITYHNLIKFRNNNYSILQNIDKKIVDNLKDIEFIGDIKEFSKELLFNGYISSIISLMVSTEYAPLFEIVNILYNYRKYDKDENARKELRDFCNKFSSYCINKKKIEFITSLEVIARNDYDLKKSFKCSEYSKISSDFLNKLKLKLFIKILNGENKEKLQYAFRDGTDLDTIKDKFIKYLGNNDIDIDSIIKYILVPLSKDKFNEIECLKNIGIDKPRDYDLYIRNINDINTVNEINCFISQIKDIYDSPTIIEILNYICHGTTIKSKIDRKMKKQLKELQFKAFEVLGEMYVDISTYSLIYTNTIDIDDEEEIIEYINYLDIIKEIKNKTTNYLNRHMNSNNIKLHHMNEYMKNTKLDNIKYPFISKYFESKKRLFTLNDLEMIFMGYDFNKGYELDEHLEDFLFSRNLIKYIALGYYKDQISNFGYIISSFKEILNYCEEMDIDLSSIDIFDIQNILMNISHNEEVNTKLVNIIYSDSYYFEEADNTKRAIIANEIYNKALIKICSSIPMLGVSNIDHCLSVLDYQDISNFEIAFNTDYRIGSTGNDLLSYSILSKDGMVLTISDSNNNIIGRINGVRNGNALFLTEPILSKEIDVTDLIKAFSKQIINYTKSSSQPIEIVLINNFDCGLTIDDTTCNYLNSPIDTNSSEYLYLKSNNLIIGNNVNANYNKGKYSIVASSVAINSNSFRSYNATIKYPRIRKDTTVINGMCTDDIINKINRIIYNTCKLNNTKYHPIDVEAYKKIYLGDDYVILINYNNEVSSFILPFDERAIEESKDILTKLTDSINLENTEIPKL